MLVKIRQTNAVEAERRRRHKAVFERAATLLTWEGVGAWPGGTLEEDRPGVGRCSATRRSDRHGGRVLTPEVEFSLRSTC